MLSRIPVLLLGAGLLVMGAARLLSADATADAAAGTLLGSGLTVVAAWIWSELHRRD